MPKLSINKFAVFFCAFTIASLAQLNLKAALGWSPELVMATLVLAAFYLSVLEMTALSALGIFILNWRPFIDWEILLFFLLPFIVMSAKKIFPWRSAISGVLSSVLSVTVFYAFSNWSAIISNTAAFSEILALTAVFSAVLVQIFNYFYRTS